MVSPSTLRQAQGKQLRTGSFDWLRTGLSNHDILVSLKPNNEEAIIKYLLLLLYYLIKVFS